LILLGIDEFSDVGVIDIILGDDLIAGGDTGRDAGDAIEISHGHSHSQIAHIGRFLGDDQIDGACFQLLDGELGGIKSDHFDLAAQALVGDHLASALGAEDIGAKDTGQIRDALQGSFSLSLGFGGIVLVVVNANQFDVGIFLEGQLAAFFALVGGADAGFDVLDVDFTGGANGFGQGFTGNLAAQDVVRTDVGDREGDRAVDLFAITDEGVVGDDG